MNPEEINSLIASRRSIFPVNFSGEKIHDHIIEQLLENANWAPTHKLTEPWRFIIYKEDGLRRLANFQGELYKKTTMKDGTFNEKKYNNLLSNPLLSSHIIAIIMKRDDSKRVREVEEIAAVACAVQNMHLTAVAYGLGAYWGTGGITYMGGIRKFFDLKANDKLLGFFYLGKPKSDWPEGKRTPVSKKIKWISK